MLKLPLLFCCVLFISQELVWSSDLDAAKKQAQQENKMILLNFSGSDWCGPCIRLHKEIFNSETFAAYAKDRLVLLNADFPRLKKNQLAKSRQLQNNKLADEYNAGGAFPLTLLLDANGKIIKRWEGLPNETPEAFVKEIISAR